jgi:hypothetical protein
MVTSLPLTLTRPTTKHGQVPLDALSSSDCPLWPPLGTRPLPSGPVASWVARPGQQADQTVSQSGPTVRMSFYVRLSAWPLPLFESCGSRARYAHLPT